jgi:penicillin-binding protein 1C
LGFAALTFWALAALGSLNLGLERPAGSHLLLDRHGRYLTEVPGFEGERGFWPLATTLPPRMVLATLDTEDRFFFRHRGVHLPSVARAIWQDLHNLRVISGASTVAMQVARMQSPAPRTLLRKAKEAIEALFLIQLYGHDAVLRQYLTLAPYGNRTHGAVRASRLYFDKPLEDLSWKQAAFLAALPQLPGRMNPFQPVGLSRALKRSERILRSLHARGVLSEEELKEALESDLALVPRPERRRTALHALLQYSQEVGSRPGPITTTTLDLDLQDEVAHIVQDNLAGLRFRDASASAALVVDVQTGEVLAQVGSQDFFSKEGRGAINYTQVKRSPGSALKPFLYGLGFETGRLTAATELADTPMDVQLAGGRSYVPENASNTFLGPMLAREALANSRNIPALRALECVGVEPFLRLLERGGVLGISYAPDRYGLSLATGSLNVTLEELVGLYTALAREGERVPLRHFLDDPPSMGTRLFSQETTQLLANILSDAISRRPSFPVGSALDYPYAVGVKTGTSTGFRDAVAIAYSDRLIVGVWVGNPDGRRMNQVTGLQGSGGAVRHIMDALMPRYQAHRGIRLSFDPPASFHPVRICSLSGRRAGADCPHIRVEHFRPGTEPAEACPYHVHRPIDVRSGLLATAHCPAQYVQQRRVLALPEVYVRWAERQHLALAPTRESPYCGPETWVEAPRVSVKEPRDHLHLLYDPEAPGEAGSLRLAARVHPSTERIVWLVDGVPIGTVGYPHVIRWNPVRGTHVIRAALERSPEMSAPIRVHVDD